MDLVSCITNWKVEDLLLLTNFPSFMGLNFAYFNLSDRDFDIIKKHTEKYIINKDKNCNTQEIFESNRLVIYLYDKEIRYKISNDERLSLLDKLCGILYGKDSLVSTLRNAGINLSSDNFDDYGSYYTSLPRGTITDYHSFERDLSIVEINNLIKYIPRLEENIETNERERTILFAKEREEIGIIDAEYNKQKAQIKEFYGKLVKESYTREIEKFSRFVKRLNRENTSRSLL